MISLPTFPKADRLEVSVIPVGANFAAQCFAVTGQSRQALDDSPEILPCRGGAEDNADELFEVISADRREARARGAAFPPVKRIR